MYTYIYRERERGDQVCVYRCLRWMLLNLSLSLHTIIIILMIIIVIMDMHTISILHLFINIMNIAYCLLPDACCLVNS